MPFHSWLPGAMVAPTPVSTYLHSATMVKAGVYLVARLAPAFADLDLWRPVVVTVGVVTMIGGGLRALRQTDLKLLLAYGTISQLGLHGRRVRLGHPGGDTAGCVMLLAHGAFKAAAFMVVGIVDHQRGTRDVRRLPRPGPGWGGVLAVAADRRRRRWRASRCCSGSSPRRPTSTAFVDQGTGGGARPRRARRRVDAHRGLQHPLPRRRRRPARRRAGRRRRPRRPRPARRPAFLAPAAVLAAVSVVLGVVARAWSTASSAPRPTPSTTPSARSTSRVWHGFNIELLLSARGPGRRRRALCRPAPASAAVPGRGAAPAVGRRRLRRRAARPQRRRQPGHGHRPARLAARSTSA